mmetsp:Transcript_38072/g.122425  ORF Transcript_38072/g.122425 Transcript_38072/m.122425 type:complete len:237 (+) Transcript_38072:179-889(+)
MNGWCRRSMLACVSEARQPLPRPQRRRRRAWRRTPRHATARGPRRCSHPLPRGSRTTRRRGHTRAHSPRARRRGSRTTRHLAAAQARRYSPRPRRHGSRTTHPLPTKVSLALGQWIFQRPCRRCLLGRGCSTTARPGQAKRPVHRPRVISSLALVWTKLRVGHSLERAASPQARPTGQWPGHPARLPHRHLTPPGGCCGARNLLAMARHFQPGARHLYPRARHLQPGARRLLSGDS